MPDSNRFEHGYPLRLTTEASVNLADDAELLELLYDANFRSVFIGIETPSQRPKPDDDRGCVFA